MNNKVAVFRKEHFNAAHRLYNPAWDDIKNDIVFGKCNNPNYHGHNYELVVKLVGEPDPETGYVMDLKVLSDLIKEKVLEKFDHKNLNQDCADCDKNTIEIFELTDNKYKQTFTKVLGLLKPVP